MRLTGRKSFITGAAKGIGLSVARAFAAEGAAVHLQISLKRRVQSSHSK